MNKERYFVWKNYDALEDIVAGGGGGGGGDDITSANVTAMTGYAKAQTASAISTSDTLNQAMGKLEKGLDGKEATIDANNKLDADLVDDSNSTNKFATAAQLTQITTNQTNINAQQNATADGGNGYALVNGIRLYVASSAPTGTIPDGSVGVGW